MKVTLTLGVDISAYRTVEVDLTLDGLSPNAIADALRSAARVAVDDVFEPEWGNKQNLRIADAIDENGVVLVEGLPVVENDTTTPWVSSAVRLPSAQTTIVGATAFGVRVFGRVLADDDAPSGVVFAEYRPDVDRWVVWEDSWGPAGIVFWMAVPDAPSFKIAPRYVIYSPNEAENDGAGFWNNNDGWGNIDRATSFSEYETEILPLPISNKRDAQWLVSPRDHC